MGLGHRLRVTALRVDEHRFDGRVTGDAHPGFGGRPVVGVDTGILDHRARQCQRLVPPPLRQCRVRVEHLVIGMRIGIGHVLDQAIRPLAPVESQRVRTLQPRAHRAERPTVHHDLLRTVAVAIFDHVVSVRLLDGIGGEVAPALPVPLSDQERREARVRATFVVLQHHFGQTIAIDVVDRQHRRMRDVPNCLVKQNERQRCEKPLLHLENQDVAGAICDPADAILTRYADQPLASAIAVQVMGDSPRALRTRTVESAVRGHPGDHLIEDNIDVAGGIQHIGDEVQVVARPRFRGVLRHIKAPWTNGRPISGRWLDRLFGQQLGHHDVAWRVRRHRCCRRGGRLGRWNRRWRHRRLCRRTRHRAGGLRCGESRFHCGLSGDQQRPASRHHERQQYEKARFPHIIQPSLRRFSMNTHQIRVLRCL